MSFRLLALTPSGVFFDKEVEEAYFPAPEGPMGIFEGYTPICFSLEPEGVMRIKENGKDRFYAVFGGVVSVTSSKTTLLTEDIEDGMTIDMARAIAARDRALDLIGGKDPNADVGRARAALNRALVRINAKTSDEGGRKS